jgi:hypothetical protein
MVERQAVDAWLIAIERSSYGMAQQWEYCHVTGYPGYEIKIFTPYTTYIKQRGKGESYEAHGYRVVSELGREGWELVSGDSRYLWFKRPRVG